MPRPAKTNQQRFEEYHAANPQVFLLFSRFAYDLLKSGHTKISSKLIIERIRWEQMVTTTGAGWHVAKKKKFLIDNRFTAWYARHFISAFPHLADKFETRAIRSP